MTHAAAEYLLYVNGRDVPAQGGKTFAVENPWNGETIARVAEGGADDIDAAVAAAEAAFAGPWGSWDGPARAEVLERAAAILRERVPELARWESLATGRPISEMQAQCSRLPDWFQYFAAAARTVEGQVAPFGKDHLTYIRRVPLGVVGLVTPWNHPLLILVKKLTPALAAGNTVVVKPSELAPTTAIELAKILAEAGLPPGVVNVVPGFGATAGKALAVNRKVRKIDLTGGTETGKIVAGLAAGHLARIAMELGGKAPVIIFNDADVEQAVAGAAFAAFIGSGQTCVQGARLLVHRDVYDRIVGQLVTRVRGIRLGDPSQPETQMGPVVSGRQMERVLEYVAIARAEGATVACGGVRATTPPLDGGYFIEPTVLTDVTPQMRIAQEEVFGPITTVIPFASDEEALAIANGVAYGLGCSIWTRDVKRAHRLAHQVQAGVVWVNDHHRIGPTLPWGGFKDSGIGRECGLQAYNEYTETQSVIVNLSDEPFDWYGGSTRYS